MGQETDAMWWLVTMAVSAVGAGFLLYGFRQKDPAVLVLGALLSLLPVVIPQWWLLLILSALSIGGYRYWKKYL